MRVNPSDDPEVALVEVSPEAVNFRVASGLREWDGNMPETLHFAAMESGWMVQIVSEEAQA